MRGRPYRWKQPCTRNHGEGDRRGREGERRGREGERRGREGGPLPFEAAVLRLEGEVGFDAGVGHDGK